MAVFVDPKSGERYENVPDDQVGVAQAKFGLIPEAEYASRQKEEAKPLVQKGLEAVEAAGNVPLRALEAAANLLPDAGGMAAVNKRLATSGPSDERAQELARAHPIATGIGQAVTEAPTAVVGGIPGAAVRVGTAALLGSAESSFARGDGYVPNARDALTYGGLQAAFEAAAGVGGMVSKLLRTNKSALEAAAERAEGFAATARREGDTAIRAERYAAEAPLHFDRIAKQGETAVDDVGRAVVDLDDALTGLKAEANEQAARGAAQDVKHELRRMLDEIKELPAARSEGNLARPPEVAGQSEAAKRVLAELREGLPLGTKPRPPLETPKGGPSRPGKKLSEMTPEKAAETRANLEVEAAVARKTPFTRKAAELEPGTTRQTMARVIDLLDETDGRNLYAVLRDSRSALTGLPDTAGAVQVIDDALGRVDVFGKTATAFNEAANAGVLRAREAWDVVARELAPDGVVDAKTIRAFVEDPAGSASLRAKIAETLEGLDASADLLRKQGRTDVLKQVQAATKGIRTVLEEADEVAGAVRAQAIGGKPLDGLYAKLGKAAARKAGSVGGGVIGGVIGGWPGAMVGGVIGDALEEPAIAIMSRLNTYRARDIAHTARAMVIRQAPKVERLAAAAASYAPSAGIAMRASTRAFLGGYDTPRQAYAASIKAVNASPEQLIASLGVELDGLPAEVRDAISLKAFETQQFLKSKMPVGIGVSLMNPEGVPPSRTAMQKWSLYYTAAMNPSSVYEDLANGRCTLEQIETLKALHPDDYNDLKSEAIRLVSGGAKPSIRQRARLHLLFDLDQVDPFFSAGMAARLQQAVDRAKLAPSKPQIQIPQTTSGASQRYAATAPPTGSM